VLKLHMFSRKSLRSGFYSHYACRRSGIRKSQVEKCSGASILLCYQELKKYIYIYKIFQAVLLSNKNVAFFKLSNHFMSSVFRENTSFSIARNISEWKQVSDLSSHCQYHCLLPTSLWRVLVLRCSSHWSGQFLSEFNF